MKFLGGIVSWLKRHFIPHEENLYRPQALSRDVLVAAVAIVCVVEGFLMASLFFQSSYREYAAAVIQSALIDLTNAERSSHGATVLRTDPQLTAAAQAKANDMAARSYFSHQGPGGEQPWVWFQSSGYDYAYAGENLATYFYESSDVVSAWMASPTHRANILKPVYRDIGIGIAEGTYEGRQTIFVVQFFGTTKSALGFASKQTTAVVAQPKATETKVAATPTSASPAAPKPATPTPVAKVQTPANVPLEITAKTTVGTPVVEGQSTSQVPGSIARYLSNPRTIALSVLGSVFAFLIIALFLAIVVRIHIQPVDLLIKGTVVAIFTLSLMAVNIYVISGSAIPQEPAAAIQSIEAQF